MEEDTVENVLEPGPAPAPRLESADKVPGGDLTGPVVNERYRLFPGQPISELDHPSAQAFVVRDETRPDDPMFARLCDRGTVIRGNLILQLRRVTEAQILRPADWGRWIGPVPSIISLR